MTRKASMESGGGSSTLPKGFGYTSATPRLPSRQGVASIDIGITTDIGETIGERRVTDLDHPSSRGMPRLKWGGTRD